MFYIFQRELPSFRFCFITFEFNDVGMSLILHCNDVSIFKVTAKSKRNEMFGRRSFAVEYPTKVENSLKLKRSSKFGIFHKIKEVKTSNTKIPNPKIL